MNKQDKTIIFIIIAVTIVTVIGATYAYWTWVSNNSQNTAVTFTTGAGFSCSANGGGNITSSDVQLVPTTCTDTARAIKRTVTVSPTITQNNGDIYLDMWLKVNSIGSGLSNSQNFKYALTTDGTSCTSGTVVAEGNFNGATTNTEKTLLHEKTYSSTTTETYYLWIWLDAAETDSATQGQSFNISLGGSCTNQSPYVYTANFYSSGATDYNQVVIGNVISNNIIQYSTKEAAMEALKITIGGATDRPYYLKHRLNSSNVVTETYVGFVVTPAMASANSGMTAGTYYLKGGDSGSAYSDNITTIISAFGSSRCTDNSSFYECTVSGTSALNANVANTGAVRVYDNQSHTCAVNGSGRSNCS